MGVLKKSAFEYELATFSKQNKSRNSGQKSKQSVKKKFLSAHDFLKKVFFSKDFSLLILEIMDKKNIQEELELLQKKQLELLEKLNQIEDDQKTTKNETTENLSNEEIMRYSRQLLLPEFGVKAQIKLSKKTKGKICIVRRSCSTLDLLIRNFYFCYNLVSILVSTIFCLFSFF